MFKAIIGMCISIALVAGTPAFSADIDTNFPSIEGAGYALINSQKFSLSQVVVDVSDSYAAYISHQIQNAEKDDIIIAHALVEGTHEPDKDGPDRDSVATFSTYIACNGLRITPFRQKSLKRSKGNHHGSFSMSGFCHVSVPNPAPISLDLMAKTSLPLPALLHSSSGTQTQLIINHYRHFTNKPTTSHITGYFYAGRQTTIFPFLMHAAPLADTWLPVDSFSADNSGPDFTFVAPEDPRDTEYTLLTLNKNIQKHDLVYLSGQGTVKEPNIKVPMFAFNLLADTTKISTATENPTLLELYRISQYGIAMWSSTSDQIKSFSSSVYTKEENEYWPTMTTIKHQSRLEGIIFRKGYHANSLFLTEIHQDQPVENLDVYPNNVQINITPPKNIVFNKTGLLRIKAYATLSYAGFDARSCNIRIGVKKGSEPETYSVYSGRDFKQPYYYHNLHAEWIYNINQPDDYKIRSFVFCDTGSDYIPISIENTGSGILIDKFEN